jgi:hypothetical protein
VWSGAVSTHSGTAIGLPHWAQGFSRGKEKKSILAMADLPFYFLLFFLKIFLKIGQDYCRMRALPAPSFLREQSGK